MCVRKGDWDVFIWEGNFSGLRAYFLIYLVVRENSSHHILQLLFPMRLHHPGVLANGDAAV